MMWPFVHACNNRTILPVIIASEANSETVLHPKLGKVAFPSNPNTLTSILFVVQKNNFSTLMVYLYKFVTSTLLPSVAYKGVF